MRLVGVFDDQLVKCELLADSLQEIGVGFVKAEPDDRPVRARECATFLDSEIFNPPALLVQHAIDDSLLPRQRLVGICVGEVARCDRKVSHRRSAAAGRARLAGAARCPVRTGWDWS